MVGLLMTGALCFYLQHDTGRRDAVQCVPCHGRSPGWPCRNVSRPYRAYHLMDSRISSGAPDEVSHSGVYFSAAFCIEDRKSKSRPMVRFRHSRSKV